MYDNDKNVDKKSAKLYDIRVLFEDYLSGPSLILLCKIQHSKKTTQNHGPLFVIPWQIKLCCYFQVHCAYMCKERENEKCLLRNLSSNEVREYMRNLSSWFYLNTTSLFSLIVLSKTNVLLPIQHPMSKRTERGNGMWGWNCQWLQPYLLTHSPCTHYTTCFLTFCRRKRFQHLQNEK